MLIGIDVDGVIANFTDAAREVCKKLYGKPADYLKQTEWDFQCLGITAEEETKMWWEIDATPNWWLSLKRLPHTEYLELLSDTCDLLFITKRRYSTVYSIAQQTQRWLATHTKVQNPSVIVTKDKGKLCRLLKVDYFIDDKFENCVDVKKKSPNTKVFVKEELYNKRQALAFGLPTVVTFNEFARRILSSGASTYQNTNALYASVLPIETEARNTFPMADGLLDYFPLALAEISKVSLVGNQQHNPGEPLHWAREKSTDHANKIIKHLIDRGLIDSDGTRHSAKAAWRVLALLQEELEAAGGNPGRASKWTNETPARQMPCGQDIQSPCDFTRKGLPILPPQSRLVAGQNTPCEWPASKDSTSTTGGVPRSLKSPSPPSDKP